MPHKNVKVAISAVLANSTGTATALTAAGASASATLIVTGGLTIVATGAVATLLRLFDDDERGGGRTAITP